MIEKIPNDTCLISMLIVTFLLGLLIGFVAKKSKGKSTGKISKLKDYNENPQNAKEIVKIKSLYNFKTLETSNKSKN